MTLRNIAERWGYKTNKTSTLKSVKPDQKPSGLRFNNLNQSHWWHELVRYDNIANLMEALVGQET